MMQRNTGVLLFLVSTAFVCCNSVSESSTEVEYPVSIIEQLTSSYFFPGEEWLDIDGNPIQAHGGGILYDPPSKMFYWYGENKNGMTYQPDRRFPARVDVVGISCYSSKDLLYWKYEGLALPADLRNAQSDIHTFRVVERPKVIFCDKTGEYVMWMHIDNVEYSTARVGVATSTTPTGPFTYQGSFRPHGTESRDMTVFKDPAAPEVAWIVYSSENNSVLHVGPLTADFKNVNGTVERIMVNKRREAPAVFYFAGRYFMITSGCTGWAPNQAEVFVARSMLGPWWSLGDPSRGSSRAARLTTFFSQASFVLPMPNANSTGKFIMMADRWRAEDLQYSRYVWLPLWVQEPPPSPLLAALGPAGDHEWFAVTLRWLEKWAIDDLLHLSTDLRAPDKDAKQLIDPATSQPISTA